YQAQVEDFSQKTEQNNEQTKINNHKTNKENQEKIAQVQSEFNKKLRFMENEKRRRDNGTGELAEVVNAQQGLTDKAIANNKYKRLSSQFKEAQANYQQRAEKDLEGYKTTLEQEATDAVALRERKVREAEVEKLKTVAKERENSLKKISLKEEVNRLDKAQHERQLMLEKDGAQNRISKLKNSYNESLNDLEQKNIASVEAMKESHLQ